MYAAKARLPSAADSVDGTPTKIGSDATFATNEPVDAPPLNSGLSLSLVKSTDWPLALSKYALIIHV